MKKHIISVLVIIALLITTSPFSQAQTVTLKKDQIEAIAKTTFESIDGKKMTVSNFKGKVLILDFWETWCAPCLKTFPVLEKLKKDYPDDFEVLAITPEFSDTKSDVVDFIKKKSYDFHFMLGKELATTLQIYGIPYKIFLDAEGNFIKAQMGIYGNFDKDYADMESIINKHKGS